MWVDENISLVIDKDDLKLAKVIHEKGVTWRIKGNYSEEVLEYLKGDINCLTVEPSSKGKLSFLRDCGARIKIFGMPDQWSKYNLEGVEFLVNMEALSLDVQSSTKVSFKSFSKLKEVSIQWQKNYSNDLFDCPMLEELYLTSYKGKEIEPLTHAKALKLLDMDYCEFGSIKGIGELSNLREFRLSNFRKLNSLDGIEGCPALELLAISASNKITDFSAIAKTPALKILDIEIKQIDSLKFLENHPTLECLAIADTKVIDGDMSVLKTIPNLKDIRFANKRHYSHKLEDLCAELALPVPCE